MLGKQMAIAKFYPSGKVKLALPAFSSQRGVPAWAMYVAAVSALFGRDDLRTQVIDLYLKHADELNASGHA